MATKINRKPGGKLSTKQSATVCLGEAGIEVGELSLETSGALKTWVSQDSGDVSSLAEAMRVAGQFNLSAQAARDILVQVGDAVAGWRSLARNLGMSASDIASFAPAFEHPEDLD